MEFPDLFTEDAVYEVPTAGSADDADSATSLFYIADDYSRLKARVVRLMSRQAHSEHPRSHTARILGNVRILSQAEGRAEIGCTFITYRAKRSKTDAFFGHHRYVLAQDGGLKIASKRSFLDADNLRAQGRVSIII